MIVLPGPCKEYSLHVSLNVVQEAEKEHGSLYLLGEKVLARTIAVSESIQILKFFYMQAGYAEDMQILDNYLLRQNCLELLTSVLLAILNPMQKLGALSEIAPGEALTAQ